MEPSLGVCLILAVTARAVPNDASFAATAPEPMPESSRAIAVSLFFEGTPVPARSGRIVAARLTAVPHMAPLRRMDTSPPHTVRRATAQPADAPVAPRAPGLAPATWGWLGTYGVLGIAWLAVWAMDPTVDVPPELRGLGLDTLAQLCLAATRDASFVGLWVMWATMGAAMMLPTALPAFRAFSTIGDTLARRTPHLSASLALPALVAGYLAVWAGFAVFAACAQIVLTKAGYLGLGSDAVNDPWLISALLIAAGLWQFSALKEACLRRCRAPTAFFFAHWRPGLPAAFHMGLRLGLDCLGCCWALMLLAFVGGTTNLLFMGAATLLMMLEKLPDIGRPLTQPVGFLLLSAGTGVAWYALLV
ncbi:MAG: DUF2182 domain-containing protein [Pseudomonadota bacterium]